MESGINEVGCGPIIPRTWSKGRWIVLLAGVPAALIAVVWADPTYVLLGLLKNESFYRGRPTSYWRGRVRLAFHGETEDKKHQAHDELRGIEPAFGESTDPAAIPVLADLLDDEDDEVRFIACNSLGALGPRAAPALHQLLYMLRQEGMYRHRNAVKALAAIGPGAKEAIPDLIQALEENDPMVNYYAATALGRIGPEAHEAVPALRKLLQSDRAQENYMGVGHKDPFNPRMETVGDAGTWALTEIDPEKFKP